MADSPRSSWLEWDAPAWNTALFRHFFGATGPDVRPVTRLVVTPEELRRTTGDTGVDPERVKEAFLDAVRLRPRDFRRKLSDGQLDRKGDWPESRVPPFVVYLLFTCFVVSSIETEVIREGDFRKRLRTLLDHPESTTYPLEGLAALWNAFACWLDRRRREGAPYRALILPDPGWMVRIGHSIRLAFPPPKDQIRLMQLLHDGGFDRDPPVGAVLHAVGTRIVGFSQRFREAFENFRRAYLQGDVDLDDHPFWSAVRDAIARPPVALGPEDAPARFQLFMESDAELSAEVVLTMNTADIEGESVRISRADQPLDDFPYILDFDDAEDGTRRAAESLLGGDCRRFPRALRQSPVRIAVEQGVLLFRPNEFGLRELATSRPEDGRIWALVRRDLVNPFRSIFPVSDRPTPVPSRYPSWHEFPSFDGSLLARLGRSLPAGLENVRCLQPTVLRPQIHLSGGVPVDGGYLGLPDCLPTVRVSGADRVILSSVELDHDDVKAVERARLQKVQHVGDTFEFPWDEDLVLDGAFTLAAWSGEEVIAQRRVDFRELVVWPAYSRPTDPKDWLVEAAGPDMAPRTSDPAAPESLEGPRASSTRGGSGSVRPASPRIRELRLSARSFSERRVSVREFHADRDADRPLARFMEISAGLAIQRKGIPEPEFLDRLGDVLRIDDYRTLWDVARAWVEAGFFDSLARRGWKGRLYFARDPRLVVWKTGDTIHATLMGVAPRHVRRRVQEIARSLDVSIRPTTSHSRWVPALLSWSASSGEALRRLAAECDLRIHHYLMPPGTFPTSLADIVAGAELDGEPHGYELRGYWNWERGLFTRELGSNDVPVAVEWYDRSDRQPVFLVRRDGTPYWSSHSRNWALLVAYTLASIPPFELVGDSDLARGVSGQIYLPLPLSRAIAAVAETSPGPAMLDNDRWTYTYSLRSQTERAAVLRAIWGSGVNTVTVRRARWLAQLIREHNSRPNARTIALSPELRNALLRNLEIPEFTALAAMNVSPFVLPHIRALITEIEK